MGAWGGGRCKGNTSLFLATCWAGRVYGPVISWRQTTFGPVKQRQSKNLIWVIMTMGCRSPFMGAETPSDDTWNVWVTSTNIFDRRPHDED